MKWFKTILMAALAGAAQVAVNRVSRQPGAPAITGGNLAAAAGTAAVIAAISHVMESPVQTAPQTFDQPDEIFEPIFEPRRVSEDAKS